jgi:uncharacterized membrane protein YdjX (TVP38/TMEM64 family)
MFNFLANIDNYINTFLLSMGIYGPIFGCFLILIESMVPILPLFVFITINFLEFGYFFGFIISWIFTVLGSLLSFLIFRKKIRTWFTKKMYNNKKIKSFMNLFAKMKFESLTLIIALPTTPAFLVNIAAGLSKIPTKKYLCILLIGKIFLVLFWGFVGTSIVESLTNPVSFLKVVILLISSYVTSKIVSKKFNLN